MIDHLGFQTYYGLLGFRGVLAAGVARLTPRRRLVAISVPQLRHAVHIRLRTSDVSTFTQVIVRQEYTCDLRNSPTAIIDAGANIGLTSVFFANRYPNATIVAIEPEASNFSVLVKNTAPYANIIAVQAALWSDVAHLEVTDPGQGHYSFQTRKPATDGRERIRNRVAGITIDEIIRKHELPFVDLLKVDIEGAERQVFRDPSRWIGSVGAIAIEMHDRFAPGCSDAVFRGTTGFVQTRRSGETLFLSRPNALSDKHERVRPTEPKAKFRFRLETE